MVYKKCIIFILINSVIHIISAKECDCVELLTCSPFMRLLRSNNSPGTRRIILSSICESNRYELKVCCPNHDFSRKNFFPNKCGRLRSGFKIVGGEETEIGEFPWIAGLGYKSDVLSDKISFQCAGSIINSRYVVTAAHCIHSNFTKGFQLSTVRLGEWNFSSSLDCLPPDRFSDKITCSPPTIDLDIEEYFIHPNFNQKRKLSYDIAIIRLRNSVNFDASKGYIEPICFPFLGYDPKFESNGDYLIAAGWGYTENRTLSEVLLKVYLPLVNDEQCSRPYGSRFTNHQLCVGGEEGRDTCMGDSGGPLMLSKRGETFTLVGIVSYGENRCNGGIPAVYTSVSEYRDWIEGIMRLW